MQRKPPATGRPTGTDGSDFSFRMVVDSRYTKVAKGKSRLRALILIQATIHLVGLVYAFLSKTGEDLNTLAVSSAGVGLVSALLGELGRSRSRINFLRVYMVASTVAVVLSVFYAVRSILTLEESTDPETYDKTGLLEFVRVQLGAVVQIIAIIITSSLIGNMSPPKRAA